jgi:hypothetical protein
VNRRTREDYEGLQRFIDKAAVAVAQVQAKLISMFPALDPEGRELPTRYSEKALEITLALEGLRSELEDERRNAVGGQE